MLTASCSGMSTSPPHQDDDILEGLYLQSFEVSSFVPCGDGLPKYGRGYWLQQSEEFHRQYRTLVDSTAGSRSAYPRVVYVRFKGSLSPSSRVFGIVWQGYGHLNQYEREVFVSKLLEMSLRDDCPR